MISTIQPVDGLVPGAEEALEAASEGDFARAAVIVLILITVVSAGGFGWFVRRTVKHLDDVRNDLKTHQEKDAELLGECKVAMTTMSERASQLLARGGQP